MSEEDERTLWCGNLAEKVTEELLYELFLQAGPVEMVKIPQDKDKRPRSFAFITFAHGASVEYAMNIFDGTRLFNRQLTIHKKSKNGQNAGSPKVNNPQQKPWPTATTTTAAAPADEPRKHAEPGPDAVCQHEPGSNDPDDDAGNDQSAEPTGAGQYGQHAAEYATEQNEP
ncbi:RNA-binding protein 7-like [Aedes aegypti]|uniref:RRM domain-containing protein n=1 Tax=Aedes aegypti TaxID=7159 RepID=A0A903VK07_AEDAE|nr:RNA-binding protein 7-like [Aedes aegypti]